MKSYIAKRLDVVEPSPTLAITALANALKAEGKDVVGFGAGEPDFDTPQFIKDAAIAALQSGFTKYTPVSGIASLKKAIIQKFEKENNLAFKPEQVIVGTGGKQVLYNLFMAIINPGDEVIIPAPYWVSYKDMVALAQGNAVLVQAPIEQNFKITAAQLKKAITSDTKAFLMNSPSNPTGVAYTKSELLEIAGVLEEHPNILVITDDIYEKLIYDDMPFFNLPMVSPALRERSVVVNGMSKAYSMTGWRLGYAASEQTSIIKAMDTIQGQSTSNANSFAQKGGEAALLGDQTCIDEMKNAFAARRNYVVKELSSLKGLRVVKPQGAFYVFPDFLNLLSAPGFKKLQAANPNEKDAGKLLASVLLKEYLVALVPGSAFGYDHGFRISYATSQEQIEKGIERIANFVSSLWAIK